MKNTIQLITTFCLLVMTNLLQAQCTQGGNNATCATAAPFCTGTTYTYCNTTGGAGLGSVSCNWINQAGNVTNSSGLGSTPNPSFFYLEVAVGGNIHIHMEQQTSGGSPIDIDFVMWGPFANTSAACTAINNNPNNNTVDCSYSPSYSEDANIFGAVVGKIYMLMLNNYANSVGEYTFSQVGGLGATNCAIVALPVELTQFDVRLNEKNDAAIITWSTVSEKNNDYFSLERRTDDGSFAEIAQIQGAGNSNEILNYEFFDRNPVQNSMNYYRLRQFDYNGNSETSNIQGVKVNSLEYTIYPNPAVNSFSINIGKFESAQIIVHALSGKQVLNEEITAMNSTVTVNFNSIEQGTYIVSVHEDNVIKSKQILIIDK